MKIFLIIFSALISLLVLLLILRNWMVQNSPYQKEFIKGKLPSPPPNGFYKGSVSFKTAWKGKVFDASSSSGINQFGEKKVFPFKTYIGEGINDKGVKVFKIDYSMPENPLWVQLILDEIVQVSNGKYLGKVHLNLPFLPLSLGYFRLEK